MSKSDIEAVEGCEFRRWGFFRQRGAANQSAEKDAATEEQIYDKERLQDEGVHFFDTMPKADGSGRNIRDEVVDRVFGPHDQHRTFAMNGLPGILAATDTVLTQDPSLEATFNDVKARIMGREGTEEFPTPDRKSGSLADTRKGRAAVFLARQFTQVVLEPNAAPIFESFVDDSQAHIPGSRKRRPKVDSGSNLRKECKGSEWKRLHENWSKEEGKTAGQSLRNEVKLGYFLARVLVPSLFADDV